MKCEKCGKQHDGSYGSGRFCSRPCANSRVQTKEANLARSKKLSHPKVYCKKCFKLLKLNNKTGYCRQCLNSSKEFSLIMSKACKGKTGGYRKNSNKGKGGYYNGIWFDSPFEIEVYKFLNNKNIKCLRNTKRFYFEWEGKKTYYIPDFYLPDINIFLEVKGYWWRPIERTLKCIKENNLNWTFLMYKKEWLKDKNILIKKLGVSSNG